MEVTDQEEDIYVAEILSATRDARDGSYTAQTLLNAYVIEAPMFSQALSIMIRRTTNHD